MNAAVLVGGAPYTPPSPQQAEESPRVIDSGLICLVMLARFHSLVADPEQLKHELGQAGEHFGVFEILLAAKKLGLVAKRASPRPERLPYASLPAMALDKDGKFFILARFEGEGDGAKVLIQDPASGRPELLTGAAFSERWGGDVILFTSRASLAGGLAKFDFTWFIPAVVKYRRLLLEVLFVSLVLQLFALVTPLFFQVVMDKVLVHRGFSTLDIIAVGLLVVSIFEVVLTAVRSYVFAHTSSRIDVELGSRLFRHLLNLPLAYFQARRVGDSVARVRELENIRSFLTGNR